VEWVVREQHGLYGEPGNMRAAWHRIAAGDTQEKDVPAIVAHLLTQYVEMEAEDKEDL
jgi:hypothetical protein